MENIQTKVSSMSGHCKFDISIERDHSKLRISRTLIMASLWTLFFVLVLPVSVSSGVVEIPSSSSSSSDSSVSIKKIISSSSSSSSFLKWKSSSNLHEPFGSPSDVKSPLHVAQCRATCLHRFNSPLAGGRKSSSPPCFQQPDCFTCWKTCELLESGWNWKDKVGLKEPICSQPRICLSGCQAACSFYESLNRQSSGVRSEEAVIPTTNQNVLVFTPNGKKIQWPKRPSGIPEIGNNLEDLVYLVVQEYSDHKWRQITQTPMSEVDIPGRTRGLNSQEESRSHKLPATRVLVVNPSGLVTMYSPQLVLPKPAGVVQVETSSITSTTTTTPKATTEFPILASDWTTTTLADPAPLTTSLYVKEHGIEAGVAGDLGKPAWNLRKVSLIHQKFLVIAELTWDEQPGAKDYLITWELDGGGLKGHLVTDSTVVTLSLWPDTVYHIQVELCGEEHSSGLKEEDGVEVEDVEVEATENSRKSFPVAVDTSEALFPMVQPSALSKTEESSHKSVTEFLNVTLLLTVSSSLFILISLGLGLLAWTRVYRRRRFGGLSLLSNMEDSSDVEFPFPKEMKKTKKNPNSCLAVAVISNSTHTTTTTTTASSSSHQGYDDPFHKIPPPMWSSLFTTIPGQHHQSAPLNT